jgi:hypothetical protein
MRYRRSGFTAPGDLIRELLQTRTRALVFEQRAEHRPHPSRTIDDAASRRDVRDMRRGLHRHQTTSFRSGDHQRRCRATCSLQLREHGSATTLRRIRCQQDEIRQQHIGGGCRGCNACALHVHVLTGQRLRQGVSEHAIPNQKQRSRARRCTTFDQRIPAATGWRSPTTQRPIVMVTTVSIKAADVR